MVFSTIGFEAMPPSPFAIKMRPWFIALLVTQIFLLCIRWWVGDPHGALLMMMVVMVGLLAVTAEGGIDVIYCTYFGLMAFVSGMMDAAIVIEKAVWASDWVPFSANDPLKKHLKPVVLLLCSLVQIASAVLCYYLYQDSEDMEAQTMLTTDQQAQVYSAVLQSRMERSALNPTETRAAAQVPQPFNGRSYKLS
eukprot:gnl/MRDRNA2_/MRDRNA2_89432_c0_seq1.p1 gnl/MRDRNA2_/MRDRNA2_89432_c0~~gnl/MRDRNA2_/MRDRNA2_89432_c0_seq1.p1  ORF type:complete len:194 (+),score=28.98 gnl/MRDRNA2_/MRDRNA2_89432_c0_seq1:121-702(+)